MRDNDFDRLIQDILKGIQVPYAPTHWDMLSNRLDSWQDPEDAGFDMDVAEGLESIQPSYQPAHWDLLSTHLDSMGNDPDIEFDEQLGERLDSIRPEYQPAHWVAMSEAVDAYDQLSDEAFDIEIADKLHQVQPPYQPEFWQMMLDKQAEHRRKMVRFITLRSAELLLLLLLWLSWPLFPTERYPEQLDIRSEQIQLPEVASSNENPPDNELFDPETSESTGSKVADVSSAEIIGSTSVENTGARDVMIQVPVPMRSLPSDLHALTARSSSSKGQSMLRIAQASSSESKHEGAVRSLDYTGNAETITLDGITGHVAMLEDMGDLSGDRTILQVLPGLSGTEVTITGPDENSFEELSTVPDIAQTVRKKRMSLSPYISADFNAIRSFPNIQELDETSLEHLTLTPGAGLGIGFHNGPWSVHSGVGYAYRFYDPNITEQFGSINGYVELNFNKVAFHMLQLPIRMHYNVVEGMKYNFYIAAGASLHYIVRQEFEKPKNYSNSFDINLATMRPQLESDQYRSGNFLTKFNEATYVTADIGFGLERKLNEDVILYIQPTYMRMFGAGVGPNFDVIHTLSLQLGLRI